MDRADLGVPEQRPERKDLVQRKRDLRGGLLQMSPERPAKPWPDCVRYNALKRLKALPFREFNGIVSLWKTRRKPPQSWLISTPALSHSGGKFFCAGRFDAYVTKYCAGRLQAGKGRWENMTPQQPNFNTYFRNTLPWRKNAALSAHIRTRKLIQSCRDWKLLLYSGEPCVFNREIVPANQRMNWRIFVPVIMNLSGWKCEQSCFE